MHDSRLGRRLTVMLGMLALLAGRPAFGELLSDGSLSVDIENTGGFNEITLNGTAIDTSDFVQGYVGDLCSAGFSDGSAVTVTDSTATYTARCGPLDVTVISRILGPLASDPNSNVLEQELMLTNPGDGEVLFSIVSEIDQDLNDDSDNDTVEFVNAALRAVVATDDPQLMAAMASIGIFDTTFGFDVDDDPDPDTTFPLGDEDAAGVGDPGPEGPGDTSMALGFNSARLAPGESGSVFFRYLFSINAATVPLDFAFPLGLTVERGANSPDPDTLVEVTAPVSDLVLMQLKLSAGAEVVNVESVDVELRNLTGNVDRFMGTVRVIHDVNGNGVIDAEDEVLGESDVDDADGEGLEDVLLTLVIEPPLQLAPFAMTHLLISAEVTEALDLAAIAPLALPRAMTQSGWLALLPSVLGLVLVRRLRRRFPRAYVGLVLVAVLWTVLLVGCPDDGGGDTISFTAAVPEGGIQTDASESGLTSSGGEEVESPTVIVEQ